MEASDLVGSEPLPLAGEGMRGVDLRPAQVGGGAGVGLDAGAGPAQQLAHRHPGLPSRQIPQRAVDDAHVALGESPAEGHELVQPVPELLAVEGILPTSIGLTIPSIVALVPPSMYPSTPVSVATRVRVATVSTSLPGRRP